MSPYAPNCWSWFPTASSPPGRGSWSAASPGTPSTTCGQERPAHTAPGRRLHTPGESARLAGNRLLPPTDGRWSRRRWNDRAGVAWAGALSASDWATRDTPVRPPAVAAVDQRTRHRRDVPPAWHGMAVGAGRAGGGRGEAFATIGLHKQFLGRAALGKCAEGRERRSAGTVGFSTGPPKRRRKPTLQVTFSRSLYRSPGSPSFSPVDESLGLPHGRAQRSHAPVPLHATGPKSSKGWGAWPRRRAARLLTRAGKRWKAKEEAMDREAETGEAVSCAVSLDGVPFRSEGDEEACRASAIPAKARTL